MEPTADRRRGSDDEHREILAILTEIKTEMAARKYIDDKVHALDKCVNGNGVPGLRTDIQLIKDQIGRINWAAGLVAAVVIADIASRIIAK